VDIRRLQLNPVPVNSRASKSPFLRGPIPLDWLGRAARLPGRTMHVAIALWHLSTLRRSPVVKMQTKILDLFSISKEVYARGLTNLEAEGLLSVERRPGQTPVVTILKGYEVITA